MYLVNLYMHAWFFQTRAWGTLSLFLFPRAGFSLPFSWILKPKYDWERKRSVRIKEEGFQLKLGGGIWGWGVGKKTFSPFCPVSLNAPNFLLFAIFITVMLNVQNPSEFQRSLQLRKKPAKQQIKRTMREWSFCYPRQQGPSLFKGSQKTFPLHWVKELLNRPWRFL